MFSSNIPDAEEVLMPLREGNEPFRRKGFTMDRGGKERNVDNHTAQTTDMSPCSVLPRIINGDLEVK